MRLSFLSLLFLSFPAMSLCQSCKSLSVPKAPVDEALFDNFYYQGNDDIYNKNDFTDAGVIKTVVAIREYNKRLGFSQKWTTDFVYRVVMLAKKEKQPKEGKA